MWCGGVNIPSSGRIVSPGRTFSSSEYSGSEIASGFASSSFFSMRSLPSQPLLLLGVLGVSCPSASDPDIEMCSGGGVVSFSSETIVLIC